MTRLIVAASLLLSAAAVAVSYCAYNTRPEIANCPFSS